MRQSRSVRYHGPRHQLVLGKGIVENVEHGVNGFKALVNFGIMKIWIDCPVQGDVRVGDGLALYTEVPIGKRN